MNTPATHDTIDTDHTAPRMHSGGYAAAAVAILVVAAGLRLYGLTATGIFGVDEGRYYLDGASKTNELALVAELAAAKWDESRGGSDFVLADALDAAYPRLGSLQPFSPKLGFNYLTALYTAAAGSSVAGCNWVEALFGILGVAFTGWYMYRLCGPRAAVFSAAILAIAPYHVYFSRNAYPQMASGFFFLCAMMALHRAVECESKDRGPRDGTLAWCGVWCGVAFWVNYQAAGALPAIPLVFGAVCWAHRREWPILRTFLRGGVLIACGFAIVMVCAEALSYPFILLFRTQGLNYPHPTFLELLAPRFTNQVDFPWNLSGAILFPYFLIQFFGVIGFAGIALLTAGGGYFIARRTATGNSDARITALLFIVLPLIATLFFFSFKTMQGARMFTYALPFFAAFLGWVLSAALDRNRPTRVMAGILGIALLVGSMWSLRDVLSIRSGYQNLVATIRTLDPPAACAAWSSPLEAYLMEADLDGGSLYGYLKRGDAPPRWYVSDWQELYNFRYPDEAIGIPEGSDPALVLDHGINRLFVTVEALPSSGNTIENIQWVRSLDVDRARQILIYDLEETGIRQ